MLIFQASAEKYTELWALGGFSSPRFKCHHNPPPNTGLSQPYGLNINYLVGVSIATIKRHDQNYPGEEKVYFLLHLVIHHPEKSEQELKVET